MIRWLTIPLRLAVAGLKSRRHLVLENLAHLHRLLKSYFAYYRRSRTHLGLDKDVPEPRPVQGPEEEPNVPEVLGG